MTLTVAVVGGGAMGSLFSGIFSAALGSSSVTMVSNWLDQIEAVKLHKGIIVDTAGTARHWEQSGRVLLPCKASLIDSVPEKAFDIALICVKSSQTAQAAKVAEKCLRYGGAVVTLQNGMGNLEMLLASFSEAKEGQVVAGSTSFAAKMLEAGVVAHTGWGDIRMALSAENERHGPVFEMNSKLLAAGFPVVVEPLRNMKSIMWGKLLINAAINPLTALLNVPNGYLPVTAACVDQMRAVCEEGERVAAAEGVKLPYISALAQSLEVALRTGANTSSMLADVQRGVPTEIDAITGYLCRRGAALKVDTPVNTTLLRLIKAKEGTFKPTGHPV